MAHRIVLFTKSWKTLSLEDLADLALNLGVDAVELTVREGYQVNPENIESSLLDAKSFFASRGIAIASAAAPLEEGVIRALGKASIPVIRVMVPIDMEMGYSSATQAFLERIHLLKNILEESHVKVGIQNHEGYFVGSALGIRNLLDQLPSSIAGAVPDFAHCMLAGEPSDLALDILKDKILYINLKNAVRIRRSGTDRHNDEWQVLWTTGSEGYCSWKSVVASLERTAPDCDICLHAEYGRPDQKGQLMGDEVLPLINEDITYLKEILRE